MLRKNRLSVISSLVLWLQWVGEISAVPQPPNAQSTKELPTVLYRGDSRSPAEIKAQGGFRLRDPSMEVEAGYSVVLHVKGAPPSGRSPENTVYVSTTDDPLVAARFLRGEEGWIYKIHAAPRVFSVAETLGKWYDYPYPVSNQREYVAMGGIGNEQIIESAYLPATDDGLVKPDTVFDFKPNLDYDQSYDLLTAGHGRPELAGFKKIPNHPANEDPFFKEIQAEGSLLENGRKFLTGAVEDAVKWSGKGPLLPPPPPHSAKSDFRLWDDDIKEPKLDVPENDKGVMTTEEVAETSVSNSW
ncbi:Heat-labile enterotoxin IIB, A chain [Beauveria bassiana]|nr:Heat-labile enterotoxin IIB, A chain [Beauveria bassiana]KAH8715447.1 Heat-labile enterotoxin IIB, A chain [Beauveria bassiana]